MDRRLAGIPASPGIVVGPVHVLLWEVPEVPQRIIDDEAIAAEIQRFHAAILPPLFLGKRRRNRSPAPKDTQFIFTFAVAQLELK